MGDWPSSALHDATDDQQPIRHRHHALAVELP
jgi:hypothetical protein